MWEGLLGPWQQKAIASPALLTRGGAWYLWPRGTGRWHFHISTSMAGKSARVESQGSTEAEEMIIRRKEALAAPTSLFVTSRLWVKEVSWGQGKCDLEQGDKVGTLPLSYAFRPRGCSQSQA